MAIKLINYVGFLVTCVLLSVSNAYAKNVSKISNQTTVALSGAEYSSPVEALADASNWCGIPSETNPCLITLMPGIYNLDVPVILVPHIDLVGSGYNNTTIKAVGFNAIEGDSASVTIADLSIESDLNAIFLTTASKPGVFTIRNVKATSQNRGAVLIRNNDTAINVENCVLTGRDGPLGFIGTISTRSLVVNVRDTELLRSDPSYIPESAIFASNAQSITLNNIKIIGYLENFQIGRVDKVNVSHLDGVGYFNFPPDTDVTVRDSRLSDQHSSTPGPVPIIWGPSYGPIKVVNTMLVGGTDVSSSEAVLLNCFDENLQPVATVN